MFDHESELPGELYDAEERERILRELSENEESPRLINQEGTNGG